MDISCVRLKPYSLDGQVILNVEQIIPLPEAAEFQVRVRQKEKEEREARTQDRDTTRFEITVQGQIFINQPKRKLAFYVVREAIERGAKPRDVLPDGRGWIIVNGFKSGAEFEAAAVNGRTSESSTSEFGRFFTDETELFKVDGNTYALTKMWGATTIETVERILATYNLSDIHYKPMAT